jgi:hypothetical protein
MSVGAGGLFIPEPVRRPSRVTGPRLRVVASHGVLRADEGGLRLDVPALGPKRITPLGRFVITLLTIAAVAALVLRVASSVDAVTPPIHYDTTVSPGQTLSQIAVAKLPGLSISNAMAQIQLANGLNTSQVHAGQLLLIPVNR